MSRAAAKGKAPSEAPSAIASDGESSDSQDEWDDQSAKFCFPRGGSAENQLCSVNGSWNRSAQTVRAFLEKPLTPIVSFSFDGDAKNMEPPEEVAAVFAKRLPAVGGAVRHISVESAQMIQHEGLAEGIGALPQLQTLRLWGCHVTGRHLEAALAPAGLTTLLLQNCTVEGSVGQAVAALAARGRLETLSIGQLTVSEFAAGLPRARRRAPGESVDYLLPVFEQAHLLRNVQVRQAEVTAEAARELARAVDRPDSRLEVLRLERSVEVAAGQQALLRGALGRQARARRTHMRLALVLAEIFDFGPRDASGARVPRRKGLRAHSGGAAAAPARAASPESSASSSSSSASPARRAPARPSQRPLNTDKADFEPGDIVWARPVGHNWWPAIVLDGAAFREDADFREGNLCVGYYGETKRNSLPPSKVLDFGSNYEALRDQRPSRRDKKLLRRYRAAVRSAHEDWSAQQPDASSCASPPPAAPSPAARAAAPPAPAPEPARERGERAGKRARAGPPRAGPWAPEEDELLFEAARAFRSQWQRERGEDGQPMESWRAFFRFIAERQPSPGAKELAAGRTAEQMLERFVYGDPAHGLEPLYIRFDRWVLSSRSPPPPPQAPPARAPDPRSPPLAPCSTSPVISPSPSPLPAHAPPSAHAATPSPAAAAGPPSPPLAMAAPTAPVAPVLPVAPAPAAAAGPAPAGAGAGRRINLRLMDGSRNVGVQLPATMADLLRVASEGLGREIVEVWDTQFNAVGAVEEMAASRAVVFYAVSRDELGPG